MVDVTAFFAAIFGFVLVLLSINVIVDRYRFRIALGDGGHPMTNRKIRAQGNFVEYVTFALVLMALAEIDGVSKELLFGLGWLLLFGRVLHAYSLMVYEVKKGKIIFRQMGMVATFTVIITLCISLLT